uniref:Uncharacterized protein n=2 Tax=Meloidogyne TaxID=189290 RepID=A0A914NTA9_MELIC|nr:unnamed protein product [Meloidogyne enterolobii]
MSQIRGKARLDRVVDWFRKEMPPKPYLFEKPKNPRDFPMPWFYNTFNKAFGRFMERQGVHFYNNVFNKTEIGLYSKDWNPRVHGIYCHWRYYGKNQDIPFSEVKLRDLRAWFGRRDYSPSAIWAEFCRLIYLYRRDYFSGAYFPNPVEFFARYYFLIMLLAFVIRGLILNDFDHTKEALYHW